MRLSTTNNARPCYLDSLIGTKTNLSIDPCKGKSIITYDNKSPHARMSVVASKWSTTKTGSVKLSTDGSFGDDGLVGAGMVLRDEKGAIILSSCRRFFYYREGIEVELCACIDGSSFTIQRSKIPAVEEMDSILAIKLIRASEVNRSIYLCIIKEIKHLMSHCESCITHVNHSHNKISDSLAKFARLEGRTMTCLGFGPSEISKLVVMNCMNLGSE
ncbi:hypothetical protein ZWY2020_024546 [Hordeum vulgare]|nr:hypothetical protein ZWY2020_024546 [Hordeum vulgare]